MDVFGGLNKAVSALQLAYKAATAVKEASAKLAMSEVMMKLADAQHELANHRMEMVQLLDRIAELEGHLKRSTNAAPELILGDDKLYYKSDNDGPFCPNCFEGKKQAVRLTQLGDALWRRIAKWRCNSCDDKFN
jgi:hypothetical protein